MALLGRFPRSPQGEVCPEIAVAALPYAVWIAAAFARPNSTIAASRNLNFWILPVTVIGKVSTNMTVPRHLVMGDLALAEVANIVGAGLVALLHADPGADLFAKFLVRDADHLHVGHGRAGVQEFLDLTRIDVLAAAENHVC